MRIALDVNGNRHEVEVPAPESLMFVLRRLGYASVKNGCNNGDCGTCAVLLDGRAVNACLLFAAKASGRQITTVEGLAADGQLHPLQQSSLTEGAVQCGFCTPGMILTALDLITRNPDPTEADVRVALAGNLCRCSGYNKQIDAVLVAARRMRGGADGS